MLPVLEFIFATPWRFLGTIVLIIAIAGGLELVAAQLRGR